MSMSIMRSECRKFAPNIFNKSKCTNCFRQKEEHSAQALESNRATRKVAKCGYLFVAPGWDFTNPLNRTKRWQRRWFVLYDDGELSYSVDEHPETVPQASIDMNKVLDVSDAEAVTGNAFSLSITASDTVTFIKGTCREECRWWADVLAVFLRSKARLKRTVTLPVGQPSQQQQSLSHHQTSSRAPVGVPVSKPTRASLPTFSQPFSPSWRDSDPHSLSASDTVPHDGQDDDDNDEDDDDVFPARSVVDASLTSRNSVSPALDARQVYGDQPASSGSPPTRDKIATEDKCRARQVQSRAFSDDLASMIPTWRDRDEKEEAAAARRVLLQELANECKRDEKLKDIAASLTRPRVPVSVSHSRPGNLRSTRTSRSSRTSTCGSGTNLADLNLAECVQPTRDGEHGKQVRGDPDGCGLDVSVQRYSPSSELRVDLPAEDLLNIKKGWLMKQGTSKEWNKHWFVLRGAALMYYRDPTSEDKGLLDGVIDLSGVSSVSELQVARNYGFQMTLWDERRYVLSAVTAGIRANWISAVRRAAGLPDQKLERERDVVDSGPRRSLLRAEREKERDRDTDTPSTPRTPRSMLFSSDDEYRTASESGPGGSGGAGGAGGVRESGSDWGDNVPLSLPPSPPLNRTPISRVKERARSRVCKRSRSSPPSSRRSTLDSVRTEDILLACCGEMPESDLEDRLSVEPVALSSLEDAAERQKRELEDMKSQLKLALCEMSSAENEVMRLRQREADSAALQRQVKEVVCSLERSEQQLEQRALEAAQSAAELDSLKERYSGLLREHDALLAQWNDQDLSQDWRALYQQMQDRYHHDKTMWEQRLNRSESDLHETAARLDELSRELDGSKSTADELRLRLASGLEENESLYARLHDLEGRNNALVLSASRERGRSVDSLSDLTNIDLDLHFDDLDKERIIDEFEELRGRFEKAVAEIRAMKRELRESHALYDELELITVALRQDVRRREEAERAQAALMAARIEDLTLKLSAADKQVRLLKQKLAKSESREKRRSLSLKGRESFQMCRELEEKLAELECKMASLESAGDSGTAYVPGVATPSSPSPSSPSPTPSLSGHSKSSRERRREGASETSKKDGSKVSARLRRKSLDSATSSEPIKVLIRLSALESKVAKAVADRGAQQDKADDKQVRVSVEPAIPDQDLTARVVRLEDVLSKSRQKMRDCLRDLTKSSTLWSSTTKQQQGVLECLEKSLQELDWLLQSCVLEENRVSSSQVKSVVVRLERLLQGKLKDLYRRRQALRQAGKLDRQAKMALVAEKLAYQTVLMSRIQLACLAEPSALDKHFEVEARELDRLMSGLTHKLGGDEPRQLGVDSSVDYLTRVVCDYLNVQTQIVSCMSRVGCSKQIALPRVPVAQSLIKRKQELDTSVDVFRGKRLRDLACCLASETLNLSSDRGDDDDNKPSILNSEDRRIREAWKMAQETVNHELVQAEISHVSMRCAQSYEVLLEREKETQFELNSTEAVAMELWVEAAESNLRKEMELNISQLTALYEECLAEMRNQKESVKKSSAKQMDDESEVSRLLAELADITAHKVLVDSRMSLLQGELTFKCDSTELKEEPTSVKMLLESEDAMSVFLGSNNDNLLGSADFQYLYQKFCGECRVAITETVKEVPEEDACSGEVMWALSDIKEELNRLQDCIQRGEDEPRTCDRADRSIEGSWSWTDICAQCAELRKKVMSIQSCVLQNQACQRCEELETQIIRLEAFHNDELKQLHETQKNEMAALSGQLETQRRSLVCQHELEQAQLKERARKLERKLDTLDSEYSLQMDNLRSAYQKTLAAGVDRDLGPGDNIRQRYQTEIEHLRALCEKGLVAMDNSHRRIIAELEEKHRQEAEQLRLEKDQALAEETQATLAALDAMRKAHEMEVQKEIAKFKAEFIKKMQATHDIGALHKEHEAEMEEIKQQILSLSDKYSVKCLESAALEEQLGLLGKQLAQAKQHILDLDARNKQLRAHLLSEASESCQLNRESTSDTADSMASSTASVDNTHGNAGSVAQGVGVDWQQTQSRVSGISDSWGLSNKGSKVVHSGVRADTASSRIRSKQVKQRLEPSLLSTPEVMRYPRRQCSSLPPLGSSLRSSSPSLSSLSAHSSSPCPLSGMVAERKKLFEQ